MTEIETLKDAVKEGMTVFDYSPEGDSNSVFFQKLVGKKGTVISLKPTAKTVSLDNILGNTHVDVIYTNIYARTLPFLGGAEDVLRRDRPIVFAIVNKSIIKKHGYTIKDVRDFMLSVGYMNMKLAEDQYAFTYEHHPSKVLL